MKKLLMLLAVGGLLLAWKNVDAQSAVRRGGAPDRQHGNVAPQGSVAPEPGAIALFASGVAPVALYMLRRHRQKK